MGSCLVLLVVFQEDKVKKNRKVTRKLELLNARQDRIEAIYRVANAIAGVISTIFTILAFLLALAQWLGIKPP